VKVLFTVMDGLADISHPELNWMTPLQAADTPNLDRLAREGGCALMYPLGPGICPSSEVSHWSMFGYERGELPGRAFLHALDADLPLQRGDALFMFNLVPVERRPEGVFVLDATAVPIQDICSAWAERLGRLAPENIGLYYMGGIEFIAVVKGGSWHISPTDPFYQHYPVKDLRAEEGWMDDEKTTRTVGMLRKLIETAEERLEMEAGGRQTTLGLTMKWPSRVDEVDSFERRHGMRAAAAVSTPCFRGMGRLLSMRVRNVEEGEAGAELEAKLQVAAEFFREGAEFVFVHSKHADEAAHRGDPVAKKEVIAAMDRALSSCGEFWEDPNLLAVITTDHSTPAIYDKRILHGGDPVPVLFRGRMVRRDGLERFDEVSAASGGLGQLAGKDLMPLILYLSRRAPFYTS
jgi:2,3-bisphosphoglycerate-independent phosphoglycerate mutase